MSKRVAEYRTLAKRIWKEAEEAQTRIPPTLQEAFQERFGKVQEDNADNVTRRINDMRSELELSQNVNSSVIRRYEELKASVSTKEFVP